MANGAQALVLHARSARNRPSVLANRGPGQWGSPLRAKDTMADIEPGRGKRPSHPAGRGMRPPSILCRCPNPTVVRSSGRLLAPRPSPRIPSSSSCPVRAVGCGVALPLPGWAWPVLHRHAYLGGFLGALTFGELAGHRETVTAHTRLSRVREPKHGLTSYRVQRN